MSYKRHTDLLADLLASLPDRPATLPASVATPCPAPSACPPVRRYGARQTGPAFAVSTNIGGRSGLGSGGVASPFDQDTEEVQTPRRQRSAGMEPPAANADAAAVGARPVTRPRRREVRRGRGGLWVGVVRIRPSLACSFLCFLPQISLHTRTPYATFALSPFTPLLPLPIHRIPHPSSLPRCPSSRHSPPLSSRSRRAGSPTTWSSFTPSRHPRRRRGRRSGSGSGRGDLPTPLPSPLLSLPLPPRPAAAAMAAAARRSKTL